MTDYSSIISLISKETNLNVDKVNEVFVGLGIDIESETAVQDLCDEDLLPFGDFRREFQEKLNVPLIKVRKAYRILHDKKQNNKENSTDKNEINKLSSMMNISNEQVILLLSGGKNIAEFLDVRQLLALYDPLNSNSIVSRILKARFGNKPIIAFNPDTNSVAIEETAKEIEYQEKGFTASEFITVNNMPVELYPIGVNPNSFFDENPVFISNPLKGDICTFTGRSWKDVSLKLRQFVRIAIEMGEIKSEKETTHNILDICNTHWDGHPDRGKCEALVWDLLSSRYPKVIIEFSRRLKMNNLPSLKIYLSQNGKFNKDNPFS